MLVVDDDPFYGALVCHAAEGLFSAQALTDACSVTAEMLIDAQTLVLDLDMPGIDGIEFIVSDLMSDLAIDQRPSLIISSGMELQVLNLVRRVAALMELHCAAVIRKPFTRDQFRQALLGISSSISSGAQKPRIQTVSPERLAQAISAGEIEPWFQPQVCLQSGRVVGIEALARWQHPRWGTLSPSFFLEAAESDELAGRFTLFMLEAALKVVSKLAGTVHYDGRLSLNIAALALGQAGFADELTRQLSRHDFPAHRLVCELTEHSAFRAESESLACMARLLMRGVSLSIDDFGTGYSNLGQLKSEAFSELKLDRAFVRDLMASQLSWRMTEGIVVSSREVGLRVVVEGVEDQAMLHAVLALGCTEAQGFYLSPPLPPSQLAVWLKRHRRYTLDEWFGNERGQAADT